MPIAITPGYCIPLPDRPLIKSQPRVAVISEVSFETAAGRKTRF